MHTSGALDAVWVHTFPYSKIPKFPKLNKDLDTGVLVIGSGISGVSIAYELVKSGAKVTMIEARDMLSGETGRTSGHLSSDLDSCYQDIVSKHGKEGGRIAAESQQWAVERIGQIAKELGIECEYRKLRSYTISEHERGTKEHDDDTEELKKEAQTEAELGLHCKFDPELTIKGWSGSVDQRGGIVYEDHATFHPTKYVAGILEWLKKQPNFEGYSRTRALNIEQKGFNIPVVNVHIGEKAVETTTEDGNTIHASAVVEATVIPLQKLSLIVEQEWMRTYCIAIRMPKGTMEDCLIYDSADAYKYGRLTACDEKDDYFILGGCDEAVGQHDDYDARYAELEEWTRKRFPQAGSLDYRWSGQVFEPVDLVAYIGRATGQDRIYVVTGDSGNGLTHGTIAGQLIPDLILDRPNKWQELYDPQKRMGSIIKSLPHMIAHDVQVNAQYKRFAQSDIKDIEDLGIGKGGVLNGATSKPLAVYKDESGQIHKMSAICPHLKGVVCWNDSEKSWDCPIHGSRFARDGTAICGPTKAGLAAA